MLFADLPQAIRLLLILLLGALSARFINWAIYSWAYFPRKLGPWSPGFDLGSAKSSSKKTKSGTRGSKSKTVEPRSWRDHLPVVGWLLLRRESSVHGQWYWVRPLLIEFLYPICLVWYYRFYFSGGTLPPGAVKFLAPLAGAMHWQFFGHWILFTLLAIATFIDFDEQTIPDLVTIPGTVIGLLGCVFSPLWLPLTLQLGPTGVIGLTELDAAWPEAWPEWLKGFSGLGMALGILAIWGFALLDRRIILRRGPSKAVRYFIARLFRNRRLSTTVLAVSIGLMLFTATCWAMDVQRWNLLLSSLLGLAFAGGVTWAVRISASYGFGAEALGFGDVTLMAMIGAFIGWQPSLLVFFLAPMLALLFVVVRWIITRDTATPYGPYLCAAVVVLLVNWDGLWTNWAAPMFALGVAPILIGLVACVALIGVMLWTWQLIKRAVFAIG